MITRLTTQKWLDVGPNWTEDEYRSAHSKMVYEYRVTCVAHYYGKGCENLCRPRDDNFGHYSCSPSGERVCLSGWKGDYCNTRKSPLFSLFFSFQRLLSHARNTCVHSHASHRDCTTRDIPPFVGIPCMKLQRRDTPLSLSLFIPCPVQRNLYGNRRDRRI